MAGVLVGAFIVCIGGLIAANASAAQRFMLGLWIAMAGGFVLLGGVADVLIR